MMTPGILIFHTLQSDGDLFSLDYHDFKCITAKTVALLYCFCNVKIMYFSELSKINGTPRQNGWGGCTDANKKKNCC